MVGVGTCVGPLNEALPLMLHHAPHAALQDEPEIRGEGGLFAGRECVDSFDNRQVPHAEKLFLWDASAEPLAMPKRDRVAEAENLRPGRVVDSQSIGRGGGSGNQQDLAQNMLHS